MPFNTEHLQLENEGVEELLKAFVGEIDAKPDMDGTCGKMLGITMPQAPHGQSKHEKMKWEWDLKNALKWFHPNEEEGEQNQSSLPEVLFYDWDTEGTFKKKHKEGMEKQSDSENKNWMWIAAV